MPCSADRNDLKNVLEIGLIVVLGGASVHGLREIFHQPPRLVFQ